MTTPIFPRLARLYESRGVKIATGLNPHHFRDYPLAPFTWFFRDGESLTNGLGIALQEIYFLECLFARFHPARLFVIGNSMGWSTLALALLNPAGRILAIDAGLDRHSLEGIEFTNRVAAEEGLSVTAVKGRSPEDVAAILREHGMTPLDFALVDGYHSIEQVQLDFDAVRPMAAPNCLYLFHDVETFDLHAGLDRIAARSGFKWELLAATPSGMALVYDPQHRSQALDDVAPFRPDPAALDAIRAAAWSHRHRLLARWRRSWRKRFGG
jgi:hypothetical protein